ncbi:MAG TPA: Ldh family oxidoreductase [Cyclobacteriaceae bacterium]|jgi:L-lactate dehydrogenase
MVYSHTDLIRFAHDVLTAAGVNSSKAFVVAETLVEADLMGHNTHGLHLLPAYAKEATEGKMKHDGEPGVVSDRGSVIVWDGNYLPGPWLVNKAMDVLMERIAEHPVGTLVIKRSHHIACLAAYPERVARAGLMMLLSSSDPRVKSVAPFGGLDPVYTPNPIAGGIPTDGDPIIFDISMSTTSNGYVLRTRDEGKKLPHPWLLTADGKATDDPNTFVQDPPATILPLGGLDTGYKGFALGILVEALTSGLAGFGRADHPDQWGASVFLQIMDPEAFGGGERFTTQMKFLVEACLASRPIGNPVRMPGTRAFQLRETQKRDGVALYPTIPPALKACGDTYGVPFPKPVGT